MPIVLFTIDDDSILVDIMAIISFILSLQRRARIMHWKHTCRPNGWLSLFVDVSTNVHCCHFIVQPFVNICLSVCLYVCVLALCVIFCVVMGRGYMSRDTKGLLSVTFCYFSSFSIFSCSTHSLPRTQKLSTEPTPIFHRLLCCGLPLCHLG
jgi:hypothetical protein